MSTPPSPRRTFLKQCSWSALPFLVPTTAAHAWAPEPAPQSDLEPVNFIYDGIPSSPKAYLERLQRIQEKTGIEADFYGSGGATAALEQEMAALTGKEKAIYLPTGTMANQIALRLLSEETTKIIVPENSHIFRDEADAAQSIHAKRLVPVGEGQPYFTAADVKRTVEALERGEVFRSGLQTLAVEHPIRRADGTAVPFEVLEELSAYAKAKGYRMHLDGARLHLAEAYTGVSVRAYAELFDTVYLSLYKYLQATGGAILCGSTALIQRAQHLIKVLGGTGFQSWTQTAVALDHLQGLSERWQRVVEQSKALVTALDQLDGITIAPVPNGTNIYHLRLAPTHALRQLATTLHDQYNIWLGRADANGTIRLTFNESLLTRSNASLLAAWTQALATAKQ